METKKSPMSTVLAGMKEKKQAMSKSVGGAGLLALVNKDPKIIGLTERPADSKVKRADPVNAEAPKTVTSPN